jgi:hypothetical protein
MAHSSMPTEISPQHLRFAPHFIGGVEYHQAETEDGGHLFLTRFGLPFALQLHPDNWLAPDWFEAHRHRLRGTSAIFRTQTKPIMGRALDVVVRYNRVGQDLPVDTLTRSTYSHATFNSPFEEIAQVMALRAARVGPERHMVPTKRPLAIYSPPTRLELWQSGRCESQIAIKQAKLPEARLDILRPYILVYGWIKGIDVQQAADHFALGGASREEFLSSAMAEVETELERAGFHVLDMKPAHIIVRLRADGRLRRRQDGRLVYALIDYELLETEERGLRRA